MDTIKSVRETLKYVRQFIGSRFVVKFDDGTIEKASERGIFSDIASLVRDGIEVTVIHSNPHFHKNGSRQNGFPIIYRKKLSKNKTCDEFAVDTAARKKVEKLIFITRVGGVFDPVLRKEMSVADVNEFLLNSAANGSIRQKLIAAINACERGVRRVHIISAEEGNIPLEIFTSDGVGTMIYPNSSSEHVRMANVRDIEDISDILRTNASSLHLGSVLDSKAIKNFRVFVVDGDVLGCMQIIDNQEHAQVEVSYLAVTDGYGDSDATQKLVEHAIRLARQRKRERVILFPNTKENVYLPIYPWFSRLGFVKVSHVGSDCWTCNIKK